MKPNSNSFFFILFSLCMCGSYCTAQSTERSKPVKSPYNLIKTIEVAGSEILSLFGVSGETPTSSAAPAPNNRRNSAKVTLQLTNGKSTINADTKNCEAGNGVCQFKIFLANQAPTDGILVAATATLRPKMKRLIVEFDKTFDSSLINEQGKVVFNVHRKADNPADDDGVIVVKDTRFAIQNGDYEVVANKVIFTLQ